LRRINLCVFCALACVIIALSGCGRTNQWMQADKLFKAKKYQEAAAAYAEATEKLPHRPELRFNRGSALYMAKEYDTSIKIFQDLAKEGNSEFNEKSEYNTGNAYLAKQKSEKAIEHYKRALYLQHDDLNAKWNLEMAQRQQKEQQNKNKNKQDQQKKDEQKKKQQQNQGKQQENQTKKGQDKQAHQEQQQVNEKKARGLSKEEAQRLLRALSEHDKELQKELRKPKGPITSAPHGKDW